MTKMLTKILPPFLAVAFLLMGIFWGHDSLANGSLLLYRPFAFGVSALFFAFILLSLYLNRPVSKTTLARDFAILIKRMIDARFALGVFMLEDGWWRLFCLKDPENGDEEGPQRIGEWSAEEVNGMIENGLEKMFRNGHIDRRCLAPGVRDVLVEMVKVSEDQEPTVAISIVYDEKD